MTSLTANLASPVPFLRLEQIVVERNRRTVLQVDNLAVARGETVAIVGPNGSGKSSLLLTLGLLIEPSQGRVWVGGELVGPRTNRVQARRRMALVFQEPLLLDQSVQANVAVGLRLRGVRGHDIARRVQPWLERLGIGHLAHRPARQLSGGEAQRTSLARALVLEPEALLLDEPFAALDAPTRADLSQQVNQIVREMGMAAVLVTHNHDEALALGDRVGVLIGGRLRQMGPPEAVFAAPADVEVAQFVGIETVVGGQVVAQGGGIARVRVAGGELDAISSLPPGQAVYVCLRADDVTLLAASEAEALPNRNHWRGLVQRVQPTGALLRVTVDCGVSITAFVTRRVAQTLALAPGTPVVVSFAAYAVHLIGD